MNLEAHEARLLDPPRVCSGHEHHPFCPLNVDCTRGAGVQRVQCVGGLRGVHSSIDASQRRSR